MQDRRAAALWTKTSPLTGSLPQPTLTSGPSCDPTRRRVFLIAPLAAKPPLGNAFTYDEVTSGRMNVESDPIGLDGGSYSTYAYAAGNSISIADPLGLCADRPRCAQLRKNIDNKSQSFANKLAKYDRTLDALGGFPYFGGRRVTIPGSHFNAIQDLQRGLANDINEYERLLCDQDDDQGPGFGSIPHSILDIATQPVLPPLWSPPSNFSSSNQSVLAAALTALLAALVGAVVVSP
jgi:hypothetical protein